MITYKEFELLRVLKSHTIISMEALKKYAMEQHYNIPYEKGDVPSVYADLENRGYVTLAGLLQQ